MMYTISRSHIFFVIVLFTAMTNAQNFHNNKNTTTNNSEDDDDDHHGDHDDDINIYNSSNTSDVISLSSEAVHVMLHDLLEDYNYHVLPSQHGQPVDVDLDMYIADLEVSSEKAALMKFDIYFRRYWKDYRLSFRHLLPPEIRNKTIQKVMFAPSFLRSIWYPEILFRNSHQVKLGKLAEKNTGMSITVDGQFFLSQRFFVTLYCPMDLKNYPFDHQSCRLEMQSYLYNNNSINLNWRKDPNTGVAYLKNRSPEGNSLMHFNYEETEVTKEQQQKRTLRHNENHDVLIVVLRIKRHLGSIINDQYLPAAMIVVFSWIGFWVDYRSVPARTSLGIVTVLSIITFVQDSESKSKSSTFLDWYILICFLFVFLGFIEYIFVNFTDQLSRAKKQSSPVGKYVNFGNSQNNFNIILPIVTIPRPTNQMPLYQQTTNNNLANGIREQNNKQNKLNNSCCTKNNDVPFLDSISRYLFPISFFSFNIVYIAIALYYNNG